jgi:diguanylate cyclase (GGDEF)-like protein
MDDTAACALTGDENARLQALRHYGILDTPLEQAFDDLARLARHICAAPIAMISFVERERQWFKAEIGMGRRETPIEQSVCRVAIQSSGVFVVPDLLSDARFASNPLVTQHPHVRFYAGAPLVTPDGFALGTVCVLDYEPRELNLPQQKMLDMLARQVMRLLELKLANDRQGQMVRELDEARQRMALLAHTDALTGLANRRSFTDRLHQQQALLKRDGSTACLLMMDIDRFKQVNDCYGHHVGDEALRLFAATCGDVFRASDMVSRWGGEEFLALLPKTSVAEGQVVAQRLNAALAAAAVPGVAPPLHLSVSVGLANFDPSRPLDLTLCALDAALYTAKNQGRNCTVTV